MKLASYKAGRDGKLIIVSRDLKRAADASAVAPTLQSALDDWDRISSKLAALAADLEAGKAQHFAFDPEQCASPLPRAYG